MFIPRIRATDKVEPEREMPGKIAATNCITPIETASMISSLVLPSTALSPLALTAEILALVSALIPFLRRKLVKIKEMPTIKMFFSFASSSAIPFMFIPVPKTGKNSMKSGKRPTISITTMFSLSSIFLKSNSFLKIFEIILKNAFISSITSFL